VNGGAQIALMIAIFGRNWLHGPIERMTLEKAGRALVISGDLTVKFGWPLQRVHADAVQNTSIRSQSAKPSADASWPTC
jgi:hypothetical protein